MQGASASGLSSARGAAQAAVGGVVCAAGGSTAATSLAPLQSSVVSYVAALAALGPATINASSARAGMMEKNSIDVAQTEQTGIAKVLSVDSVYTQQIGD